MQFTITSKQKEELIDITQEVNELVKKSNIKEGICLIYVAHATAGLIINENADPNINIDFLKQLNKLIPRHAGYLHDRIDDNADSHIKSAILGCSQTIPVKNNTLQLGTWQALMLCEFDGPRQRKIIVKIMH